MKRILRWFKSLGNRQEQQGKVKFFNPRKGYGFIESESLDRDVFVHVTHLEQTITKGDRVEFSVAVSEKGYEARNVKRV